MITLLNISFPILIWLGIRLLNRKLSRKPSVVCMTTVLCTSALMGTPMLFDYKFSNWVIEYLSVPMLASAVAMLICLPAWIVNDLKGTFWVFLIAAILNGGYQVLALFGAAFGGGDYPSHYEPEPDWTIEGYYISELYSQGFAGPAFRPFVVHKPILNGWLYKKVAQTTENDTSKCAIVLYGSAGKEMFLFDRCEETLRLEKRVR